MEVPDVGRAHREFEVLAWGELEAEVALGLELLQDHDGGSVGVADGEADSQAGQ